MLEGLEGGGLGANQIIDPAGKDARGGWSPGKRIPLLGRHRETPTLTGTKFAKPYPYWHKIWAQIHILTGTNPQKEYHLWHNYC